MKLPSFIFALLVLTVSSPAGTRKVADIEYARVGGVSLKLDLHLPPENTLLKSPLIVYVHGGAWRSGTRSEMPLGKLVEEGFPVASVDYRLSPVARFPAQVHDIRAAIRYIRARAADLHVEAGHIIIVGNSAGGHLAALVGVTNGVKELEGDMGDHLDQSSDVQGIVSLYGASNLETILGQSTEHGLSVRIPALELLLGGLPTANRELTRLASPVNHVDRSDPPLLLIHGDADPQMPIAQSFELQQKYEAAKLPVRLEILKGGKHGGAEFYDEQRTALMFEFLRK